MRSRYIQKAQLEKLRYGSAGHWDIYALMLSTGMRVGDACAIKGKNFHFSDGVWRVSWVAEKTGKRAAAVVPSALASRLHKAGKAYCFPGRGASGHITRQTVWKWLKTVARAIGDADGVSPHSMRKVYAVELMHRSGLSAVQTALQHQNPAVTRVYAYADTVLNFESDEPIRWRDVELLVDYILQRIVEKPVDKSGIV